MAEPSKNDADAATAAPLDEDELKVSFHCVDEIPSTQSGKPQIIESNLQ